MAGVQVTYLSVYANRHTSLSAHYIITDATPQLTLQHAGGPGARLAVFTGPPGWDQGGTRPGASQRPHLDGVDVRGVPGFGAHVRLRKAIAGDDEDDGGGAESHLLLRSGAFGARPGHDDGPDGALHWREGPLFEAALQPREAGAEQLQQTAAELWGKHDRRPISAHLCIRFGKEIYCFELKMKAPPDRSSISPL